jgi:rubrerythrin
MFVFGNADDVFGMAVRIEENGHLFYSAAAKKTQDAVAKKLFEDLALMEAGHIATFKGLRSTLPGSWPADAIWDPEGLGESYLQATADMHVFTRESAESRLEKVKDPIEIFDLALQFEKDSVAFFVGVKEILPDLASKKEIDTLIQAEMDHVRMLSMARKKFGDTGKSFVA